jgi:hypothetical protein
VKRKERSSEWGERRERGEKGGREGGREVVDRERGGRDRQRQ